jgi:hypothetical protein
VGTEEALALAQKQIGRRHKIVDEAAGLGGIGGHAPSGTHYR